MSIRYTWKNIRQQYKNNKLKLIAQTWNDKFEFPDGFNSVPDIQDYIKYIISSTNRSTHIYINRINNRLVFKIKDGWIKYKPTETMKLFGSAKKLIDKTKNGENVPILEVVEVVLVQCDLIDNQYKETPEVLYTFTPNKSYVSLLNVEPRHLVLLENCNTEFDKKFKDQIGRSL